MQVPEYCLDRKNVIAHLTSNKLFYILEYIAVFPLNILILLQFSH